MLFLRSILMASNLNHLKLLQICNPNGTLLVTLFTVNRPVHEMIEEKTIWKGDVEVFDLYGHPSAKKCYCVVAG